MEILRSGKQDVYIAVAERFERYIKAGVLKKGDKLTSVRVTAEELGVNPNTDQKAYTLLENRGLIYSIPKKGAFVSYSLTDESEAKEKSLARQLLTSLKADGVTKETVINLLEEIYSND